MRKFDETIFFGREDCLEKCYILHRRLEEAFDILGGLQQPNHSDSEETEKEVDFFASNLEEDLADIGMDIIIALGLSEVLSKKKPRELNLFDAAKKYAVAVNDRLTCKSHRDYFIEKKYEDALENLGGASLDYAISVKSPPYDK